MGYCQLPAFLCESGVERVIHVMSLFSPKRVSSAPSLESCTLIQYECWGRDPSLQKEKHLKWIEEWVTPNCILGPTFHLEGWGKEHWFSAFGCTLCIVKGSSLGGQNKSKTRRAFALDVSNSGLILDIPYHLLNTAKSNF